MTKEELYEMTLLPVRSKEEQDFQNAITDFIDNYVCIPKGQNRHPYADVFHEAMEDTNKVIQFEDGHAGCDWTNLYLAKNRKHRIKPSEPVYEYQWILNGEVSDIKFYTEAEASGWSCCSIIKIEETKRIRQ